jgi:hypothetical protein
MEDSGHLVMQLVKLRVDLIARLTTVKGVENSTTLQVNVHIVDVGLFSAVKRQ